MIRANMLETKRLDARIHGGEMQHLRRGLHRTRHRHRRRGVAEVAEEAEPTEPALLLRDRRRRRLTVARVEVIDPSVAMNVDLRSTSLEIVVQARR